MGWFKVIIIFKTAMCNVTKKQDILLCYKYFKRIKQCSRGKQFKNVTKSDSEALKVSQRSVLRVVKVSKSGSRKPIKHNKVDDFNKDFTRKKVACM